MIIYNEQPNSTDAGIDVAARNYKHINRQDAGRWKMTGSDNPK